MPDWFYQPIYKPIVTNLLNAEQARRLTLFAMGVQSRFGIGRQIFDLLSRTSPPMVIPKNMETTIFGLRFPTPIGMAHGIDIEAHALPLWSMLGLGYVQIGVLDTDDRRDDFEQTQLIPQVHAIVSNQQASVCVDDVLDRVKAYRDRKAPLCVALSDTHIVETIRAINDEADFFSIPCAVALNVTHLNEIRASTTKPLLIRLSLSDDDNQLTQMIENAFQAGFDGCIIIDGEASNLIEDGLIHGAHLHERAIVWVSRIVKQYGDAFPVIGSGGILTPEDAIDFLNAGAKLVQLYEGLIYAGPGLPRRIIHALLHPKIKHIPQIESKEADTSYASLATWGWRMLLFVGVMLIFGGVMGIVWAILFQLFPYELDYMQLTSPELSSYLDGRLSGFIFHDRVIYHGALISYGILYSWMALYPLHPSRGEAWAWWALLISGTIGALSTYISYVYSDYLDIWYGSASVLLVALYYMGLILSYRTLKQPKNLKTLFKAGSQMWLWSPAGIGRTYLLFWAITTAFGGLLIFQTGMNDIFVREDLAYMQTTAEAIQQISPTLVAFIAHDRIGFGVTLFAIGIAAVAIIWKGICPQSKSVLVALTLAFLVHDLTAIWVHPIVGYNSFMHLLPFLVKDTAFLFAIFHLYRPMIQVPSNEQFADL